MTALRSTLRYVLPHVFIWSLAVLLVSYFPLTTSCLGFCAIYVAWIAYGALAAASALSAIAAMVQILVFLPGFGNRPAHYIRSARATGDVATIASLAIDA